MTAFDLALYIVAAGAGLFIVFLLFLLAVFLWFALQGMLAPKDGM